MEAKLEQEILKATEIIEKQVDAEIERLEKMDEDDFEVLKQKRLSALKNQAEQKRKWLELGHGQYSEIPDEKEFFEVTKNSKNVICHFYRDSTFRCKILDKHLALLAPKHVEARFVKINAEKSKFLCEKLRIKVLPTVCLIKDGQVIDYIVGFDDLGGRDDFSTERLEWRIACLGMINYEGDLTTPPDEKKSTKKAIFGYDKTIRGQNSSDDDD